jgi:hypothetical protein
VEGVSSWVASHGTASRVDSELLLAVTGITDRPGNTLNQLVGCVSDEQVLWADFLIHENRASLEPGVGIVGDNDDS